VSAFFRKSTGRVARAPAAPFPPASDSLRTHANLVRACLDRTTDAHTTSRRDSITWATTGRRWDDGAAAHVATNDPLTTRAHRSATRARGRQPRPPPLRAHAGPSCLTSRRRHHRPAPNSRDAPSRRQPNSCCGLIPCRRSTLHVGPPGLSSRLLCRALCRPPPPARPVPGISSIRPHRRDASSPPSRLASA